MTPAEAAGILNVSINASTEEIMHAYRTQARTCHPDLMAGAPQHEVAAAEAIFVRVTAARDILLTTAGHNHEEAPTPRETVGPRQEYLTPAPPGWRAFSVWVALLVVGVVLSYVGGPLPMNLYDLLLRLIPLAVCAALFGATGRPAYFRLALILSIATAVTTFALASFGALLALDVLLVPLVALGIMGRRRMRQRLMRQRG